MKKKRKKIGHQICEAAATGHNYRHDHHRLIAAQRLISSPACLGRSYQLRLLHTLLA